MTHYYETMSNDIKSFDWNTLPPGEYKMEGTKLFRINEEKSSYDSAADQFVSALSRLAS
jgi:hypothetical protein